MIKIDKDITEPTFLNVQSISDDRGILLPFTDHIDHELFHRCYIVENYGVGVIRGLHYHKEETKIFTVVSGAGKFITVKLAPELVERENEEEIRKYTEEHPEVVKSFVLSSKHHGVIVIPPKFANGWISLQDNTILVALSNLRFEKAKDDDLRLSPYIINEDYWKVIGR